MREAIMQCRPLNAWWCSHSGPQALSLLCVVHLSGSFEADSVRRGDCVSGVPSLETDAVLRSRCSVLALQLQLATYYWFCILRLHLSWGIS
ncbi:hypothetical protein NDU88_005136 [Pleurodeles waltl]|uniref:Secreted protein n=1 Tax=Pleurodeles waltl TaxID=8319 RepID=A0AAV7W701_PLEWA|nr:hypothetical protein NDU88_005136 [Pleurodeles waltl]